jgi:hypothetical protein
LNQDAGAAALSEVLMMTNNNPAIMRRADIDAFLAKIKPIPKGRLIFGLDATMSRQPTWDTACRLQAEMFREAAMIGGLDVQLIYYRGLNECRTSQWISDAQRLGALMEKIDCRGGHTQIGKILAHAKRETQTFKVSALVFVGDALEESADDLCHTASALGQLGVPTFMFQEGNAGVVAQTFREVARLTRGAYCRFDSGAAQQFAQLLRAVAIYAAGGLTALAARSDAGAIKLITQLSK